MESREKKWIVFGAGAFGREVYYYYGKDHIAYFVDNDCERAGDLFFGKEIISFKQYCKIYGQYNTVIAVRHYQSIERQLLEKGITEYTIYLKQRENVLIDEEDDYRKYLYTPTYITQIDSLYFIVDCWHHRVIYAQNLERQISDWKVLDDTLSGPHSISSDGEVYVVDDTDHGEVCVYKKRGGVFTKTQTIYGLGFRPHKCVYDDAKGYFYVLLSESCEIVLLKNHHDIVKAEAILKAEVDTYYARSIQIIDEKVFLVCRNGYICELEIDLGGVKIVNQYKMPDQYAGLNDMIKVGNSYYLSVYTDLDGKYVSQVVKTCHLEDLNHLENVTAKLGTKGIPYYFSAIDGRYYISEIDTCSGISSFLADGDELTDRKEHFLFYKTQNCSLKRRFGAESSYDLEIRKNTNIATGILKNISNRVLELKKNLIPPIAGFYVGRERENLISWYPFKNNASVLEIVSECGSVSNILCEKCKTVTSVAANDCVAEMVYFLCREYDNIDICIESIPEGRTFDYILAVNLNLEGLDRLLSISRKKLRKNGKLIAVINNKLSESYWADQEVQIPFRREHAVKKDIESVCAKWHKKCSFFYPLPDWTKCEMICSDFMNRLPGADVLESVFYSRPIYDTPLQRVVENHGVSVMAQTFLLEIADTVAFEREIAVNIASTKRKKEFQLNTSILANGYVEKSAVFKAGAMHIKQIMKNEAKLESRGIRTLKGKLQGEKYLVKYAADNTLDKILYRLYQSKNEKEAFRLMEILRQSIDSSSDHVMHNGKDVLETGYLDMVCQNVFVDKDNFLFFDQEWTMHYVEPEFIIYRAVKLLYLNNAELENIFPMHRMIKNIGGIENVEKYETQDAAFRRNVSGGEFT